MTHYEVLEVAPGAPPSEVRRAYLRLARTHHPDHGGPDDERMRLINAAWAVLGDDARRAAYDAELAAPPAGSPAAGPGGWSGDDDLRDVDDLGDLADDRPIGVPAPRWLAMLPATVLGTSVMTVLVGLLLRLPPVIVAALVMFAVAVVLFLITPFIALTASRRADRAR